jgi:hypothetical protein
MQQSMSYLMAFFESWMGKVVMNCDFIYKGFTGKFWQTPASRGVSHVIAQ